MKDESNKQATELKRSVTEHLTVNLASSEGWLACLLLATTLALTCQGSSNIHKKHKEIITYRNATNLPISICVKVARQGWKIFRLTSRFRICKDFTLL